AQVRQGGSHFCVGAFGKLAILVDRRPIEALPLLRVTVTVDHIPQIIFDSSKERTVFSSELRSVLYGFPKIGRCGWFAANIQHRSVVAQRVGHGAQVEMPALRLLALDVNVPVEERFGLRAIALLSQEHVCQKVGSFDSFGTIMAERR